MTPNCLIAAAYPDESDWVRSAVAGFGESVLSVVPSGFASCARLFHPAMSKGVPVRWRQAATTMDTTAHRAMQRPSLVGDNKLELLSGGSVD
jgi:hypothetical protein